MDTSRVRALLTKWWWEWAASVHDRLHVERDALWDNYQWTPIRTTTNAATTVIIGSDDG